MGAADIATVWARPVALFCVATLPSFSWAGDAPLVRLLAAIFLVLALAVIALDGGPQKPPRLHGGGNMQHIFDAVPLLTQPLSRLQYNDILQLAFVAASNVFGKNPHKFASKELKVQLRGDSVLKDSDGSVWIHWLETQQKLKEDSPIVIMVPGLANTKDSLPGCTIYDILVQKPWRVVTYEKRGVGHGHAKLTSPIFHMFGHPSDFHTAVQAIKESYPKAPLHIISFSAGNGLSGTYLRAYSETLGPNYRGCLMLNGGEDYNKGTILRRAGTVDNLVEARLVQFVRNYYVRDNAEMLKAHNPEAFAAAMGAKDLHEFYLATMRGFSGFSDPDEAEKRINGFLGGNGWFPSHEGPPCLGMYTADDPIGWHLSDEWIANLEASPNVAGVVFAHGSHCASYNVEGGRWCDTLIVQWVEALEAAAKNGKH